MQKNFKATVFFLLVAALFYLSACNGQATATLPSQEKTPTFTPTIESTATSTMLPFAATRLASVLAHAPTETALAQNALVDCNGYPDKMWKPYDQVVSPSGIWRIAYCQHPNTGANYTKVINTKTGITWEVPCLDQEGQNRPEGMTGGIMGLEMWSSDEKFVYFNRYYCCLDGPSMIFSDGFGLFKMELSNGKIVEIESGVLSPDGYSIIFYDYGNHVVVIKDLKTDQTTLFKFDERLEEAGIFKWSRDESKIVFSAADQNWFETDSGFVVYLIDIKEGTIRQLLFEPPHNYIALDWLSETEILFGEARQDGEFILNISTNEITQTDSFGLTLTTSP